jgi:hypothetical protein
MPKAGVERMDRTTHLRPWRCDREEIGLPVLELTDEVALYAKYGVGDMVGIPGAEDRVVTLSQQSDVVCPLHAFRLLPDACRSCRFLAGEAR